MKLNSWTANPTQSPHIFSKRDVMHDLLLHTTYALATSWCLLSVVAVAFTLQFAVTRYYDLSQALGILAGGYVSVFVHDAGVHLVIAFGSGATVGGIIGVAALKLIHAPLAARHAAPLTHFLASAGLAVAGQNVVALVVGDTSRRITVASGEGFTLSSLTVPGISVLCLMGVAATMRLLPTGQAAAFVASDTEVAAGTGINVVAVLGRVCALSGALMGVVGACMAWDLSITPTTATPLLLDGIVVSLLRWRRGTWPLLITTATLVAAKQTVIFIAGAHWQDALTYALFMIAVISHGPTRTLRWS